MDGSTRCCAVLDLSTMFSFRVHGETSVEETGWVNHHHLRPSLYGVRNIFIAQCNTRKCEGTMMRDTTQLRVGDRVFDKHPTEDESETPSLGVVTKVHQTSAGSHTINTPEGTTTLLEYGVNDEYAEPGDTVVTVMFTRWLDQNCPRWDEHADDPDSLIDHLRTMADKWGIPLSNGEYEYPESRLELRHRP